MSATTEQQLATQAADGLVGLIDATVRVGRHCCALQGRRATDLVSTLQRAAPRLPMSRGGLRMRHPASLLDAAEIGAVTSHVCSGVARPCGCA